MSLMLRAGGISKITDTIYKDRFKHISELQRFGADIELIDHTAIISGGKKLSGATVMASDLRAGAALLITALMIDGTSEILRVYHIDRGYEDIVGKLSKLGDSIKREATTEF
jgi:UDP-N-acetylglucosamine 1-carboxyvinyltransferase